MNHVSRLEDENNKLNSLLLDKHEREHRHNSITTIPSNRSNGSKSFHFESNDNNDYNDNVNNNNNNNDSHLEDELGDMMPNVINPPSTKHLITNENEITDEKEKITPSQISNDARDEFIRLVCYMLY